MEKLSQTLKLMYCMSVQILLNILFDSLALCAGNSTFRVFVENTVVGAGIWVGIPEVVSTEAQGRQIDFLLHYSLPHLCPQGFDVPARWIHICNLSVMALACTFSITDSVHASPTKG